MTTLPKRTFPQIQNETKLSPTYEYSPEHAPSTFSEGEAPLIHTTPHAPSSPPFIRIPLEDRSKYEKLTGSQDDISSDGSSDKEKEMSYKHDKVKKRRNIKNIPEKIHSVCSKVDIPKVKNLIADRKGNEKKRNKNAGESVEYESDDSIGSASDLRANDDTVETGDVDKNKMDEISETISESIHTCGSSAYHAECESMATREEDATSRIIRLKKASQPPPPPPVEDMLFVGHQYGDKPLLLDDELDSDCELKLENSTWSVEKKNQSDDIWSIPENYDDAVDDVFACAPLPRGIQKSKKRFEDATNIVTPIQEETINDLSLLHDDTPKPSRNQSPLLILSPPNPDIPNKNYTNIPQNNFNNFDDMIQIDNFPVNNLNPFVDNATSTPKVVQSVSHYGVVTVNNTNVINIEIPSSSRKNLFETEDFGRFSPFLENTNFVQTPDADPPNYFSPQNTPNQIIYENITIPIQSFEETPEESFAFIRNSDFNKEIRFDAKFEQSDFNSYETSDFFPANIENQYFRQAPDDGKKDKKGKSKYQLIDTELSDDKSSKNKIGKSNMGFKKVSSKNKKSPKMPVGFSNMSFEDFPSDESEQVNNYSTPFEVVRKSYDDDKKYGSLKRRSNPFS